jgi:hypothetical protein
MGPSKTESLSGYRLGVAFGSAAIIERMEKLQAIVSLRAAGYNQAVLRSWFGEPAGWIENRVKQHQAIRDDVIRVFEARVFLPVPRRRAAICSRHCLRLQSISLTSCVSCVTKPRSSLRRAQSSDRMRTVSASTFHRIAQLLWKPQNASSTWSVVTGRERRSCRSVRLRCVSFRFEIGIRLSRGCVSERPPLGARHCRALFCTDGWQCASLGFKPLAHRGHHELGARADSGRPPCRDRS